MENKKRIGNYVEFKDSNFATLYLKDNEVLKVYDSTIRSDFRLSEKMFDELSSLKSKAFLNLRDCYMDDINIEGYTENVVSAYSYDFIEKMSTKMIDMPMEYTIESLYRFKNLVELLNMHRIMICDAHSLNVIPNENGLVIIDPDRYYFAPDAHAYNLYKINEYISDLWGDEYGLFDDDPERDKIKNLFYSDDLFHYLEVMQSRLNEKTPRDLLDKVYRKKRRNI